ncbi:hypothetical protein PIB30_086954 [Stylosanthes scabra]|uniref:Peroxidase n=1 Tax=Stylosanthes scabra TaxID=79078 RepID=A0ABU6QTA1_9FABA|nr:hypothetical protein [Stylosanthes scabra]
MCDLSYDFYDETCPSIFDVVRTEMLSARANDLRIPASLLRLHFHDCFVLGCDGSVLLDDTINFTGEKNAVPNKNSARGFGVIDKIKYVLENKCPSTVSCADILALAARDAVVLSYGPRWRVLLGRRDGRRASFAEANDLPSPLDSIENITYKFRLKGLDTNDVAALSGAHTIGLVQCRFFKERLYNFNNTGKPDPTLDPILVKELQIICGCPNYTFDSNLSPLDRGTPILFDNNYYTNVDTKRGILSSDHALLNDDTISSLVNKYSQNQDLFFNDFVVSMEKMGRIGVLLGQQGEIRTNCSRINYY